MWSVAGVYAGDGAEAVSTSRRAVCVPIIKKKWTMILKIEMLSMIPKFDKIYTAVQICGYELLDLVDWYIRCHNLLVIYWTSLTTIWSKIVVVNKTQLMVNLLFNFHIFINQSLNCDNCICELC
jgi:hypothetical protein